jgi:hemoglobin
MAVHAQPPVPCRDLDDPGQIAEMVTRFYGDVDLDPILGPLFNDVAQVDWPEHLEKLTAFWCRALLGIQGYAGNPFRAHKEVHQQRSFTDAHFLRWLTLFEQTVRGGWSGPNAERAVALACNVARVHSNQFLDAPVAIPESIEYGASAGGGPANGMPVSAPTRAVGR